MLAVTRAARHRDRSLVASAGCQLIPWDGTAGTVVLGAGSLWDPCALWLPPSPAQRREMQPRWDFSPVVFPEHCPVVDGSAPGKARGAGGICVKRVVLRNKMMLELRAAGCCIPRVPVLLNKGMTKENDF